MGAAEKEFKEVHGRNCFEPEPHEEIDPEIQFQHIKHEDIKVGFEDDSYSHTIIDFKKDLERMTKCSLCSYDFFNG